MNGAMPSGPRASTSDEADAERHDLQHRGELGEPLGDLGRDALGHELRRQHGDRP